MRATSLNMTQRTLLDVEVKKREFEKETWLLVSKLLSGRSTTNRRSSAAHRSFIPARSKIILPS